MADREEIRSAFKAWKADRKKEKERRLQNIPNWSQIRKLILDRDGYLCRICSADACEASLDVHHIDWDRRNNATRNLVTLCKDCHKAVHMHNYRPDGIEAEPWGDRG